MEAGGAAAADDMRAAYEPAPALRTVMSLAV